MSVRDGYRDPKEPPRSLAEITGTSEAPVATLGDLRRGWRSWSARQLQRHALSDSYERASRSPRGLTMWGD